MQSQAIDSGNASRWAATFTSDGEFDSPTYGRAIRGAPELVAFALNVHKANGSAVQRHYPSNLSARLVDPDRIDARCYVQIVVTAPGGAPQLARAVTQADELVRTDAGWRVQRRTVAVDGHASTLGKISPAIERDPSSAGGPPEQ